MLVELISVLQTLHEFGGLNMILPILVGLDPRESAVPVLGVLLHELAERVQIEPVLVVRIRYYCLWQDAHHLLRP